MQTLLHFLVRHGYAVLFAWVLLEQGGLPLPSIPLLLAAGALAGAHDFSLALALLLPVVAATISDFGWYQIGRRRGGRVLNLICRISLEPDSCARRTEDLYQTYGAKSLLLAKFVPGLTTVAPPLAGVFRMRPSKFIAYDVAGSLLWSTSVTGLGYIFSNQLEEVARYGLRFGEFVLVLLIGGLGAYLAYKYEQRQKFLRKLRVARISPEELKAKLERGENIQIVDLRNALAFEAEPITIPGALHFDPKELAERHGEVPRDRDVVLYCT